MSQNKYILSIRVSSDGFFLSVRDSNSGVTFLNRVIPALPFSLCTDDIINLLSIEKEIIHGEYCKVELIVETDEYVFVPATIFNPKETDTYFYFQYANNDDNIVLFNRIADRDTVNVFSVPKSVYKALNDLFPDQSIVHHLSNILSDRINSGKDVLFVWVRAQSFDVMALDNNKLCLINTYHYRTSEDMAYYILSIFEQLNLDPEITIVRLYQREKTFTHQYILSQYVKNCDVLLQS